MLAKHHRQSTLLGLWEMSTVEPVGVLSFGTGEVGSGGGRSGMSLVMLNRALSPELSRVFNSMKHSYEEHIVCVSMM